MSKTHLKRIALPRTWNVPRKSLNRQKMKFVSRPNPGKGIELGVSVNTFLKEIVFLAKTKKEVKALLQFKHVFVNGTRVRDEKFPVGLFDVVYLEELDQSFRLTLSELGKIAAVDIDKKEKDSFIKRIEGKTLMKGDKLQMNLFGGSNFIVEKDQGNTGDTFVIVDGKVKSTIELTKGNLVFLTAGRHIGAIAKVVKVQDEVIFIEVDGNEIETLKKYAYVIGEKSPAVTVRQ